MVWPRRSESAPAPLALVVRDLRGASLPIVQRFSALAVPAVGLMVLAGLILSVVQLESPAALLTTGYGRIFLAKMAAVLCLLGLAALNRQRLTPMLSRKDGWVPLSAALHRGRDRAGRRHPRACGDVALHAAARGLSWRLTAEPVNMHIHTPAGHGRDVVGAGQGGPVTMNLSLMTGDFGALDPKEVTVAAGELRRWDRADRTRRAIRKADGTWQVEGLVLPVPGQWQVRVDVLISDFEKATLEDGVEFRP